MSRTHRPHLHGVPFHLTARVQGKEPLLAGLERTVAQTIVLCAEQADGQLLAYAVMPNHLHLIYVQGRRGLAYFMQPLLTRVALLVHRRYQRTDHVFGKRFAERACLDALYLRNALCYVHLNPVRAALCTHAAGYEWSSHSLMCTATEDKAAGRFGWGLVRALQMFAPHAAATAAECRIAYLKFVAWRLEVDRVCAEGDDVNAPPPPEFPGGDLNWIHHFGAACAPFANRALIRRRRTLPDLRDFMRATLAEIEPELPFDLLRSGGRAKPLVRVRNAAIVRALEQGYTGASISCFLRISSSVVSRIARRRGV